MISSIVIFLGFSSVFLLVPVVIVGIVWGDIIIVHLGKGKNVIEVENYCDITKAILCVPACLRHSSTGISKRSAMTFPMMDKQLKIEETTTRVSKLTIQLFFWTEREPGAK